MISANRNIVFISHANPEDNDFTRWLSLKLIGLGFEVWCDVLKLKGGEDFWIEIEKIIRKSTIKFLYVLSRYSNNREGTLKELAVALKVKKHLNDERYVIPLNIDSNLSYDEISIDIIRFNNIDFKVNWASGLKSLLDLFEEDNVPKQDNKFDIVNLYWKNSFLQNNQPIDKKDIYVSNWFEIEKIPDQINFHRYEKVVLNKLNSSLISYPVNGNLQCTKIGN